jgi:hypothetical protein
MRYRRRIRLVRRFVLGLAVAAIAAPAAQGVVPDRDISVPAARSPEGALVQGDYKSGLEEGPLVRRQWPEGATLQGENKGQLPEAVYVPFVTDFPRTTPAPGGELDSPVGYRRALPQDYGVVPVEAVRGPSAFDWADAFTGAGGAFLLLLLAGGATLATRHIRPAAA